MSCTKESNPNTTHITKPAWCLSSQSQGQDHGVQVFSRHLPLLFAGHAAAAACSCSLHGDLSRGDEVHLRRAAPGPAHAHRPAGVRPGEPRLRPPRRRALHRRLQWPRPPLARRPPRLDRVRPQLQARDGAGVRGEEKAGGAGERVRAAAGPAVPPRVRRPLLRGRVPGPDARRAPRRAGGGGGDGGRQRAAQLRQRRGRRPGDRPRVLHRQQHNVPAQRLHDDHPHRRRDGAAAAVRPVHGQRHRASLRPRLPQRRRAQRRPDPPRGGGDHVVPPAPALAARAARGDHGAVRGSAGVPGQRATRRRPRRVLGGAQPGQVVGGRRHDAEVRGRRQGPRRGRRRGGGAARARERHGQRGAGAGRRALARIRRHALRPPVQDLSALVAEANRGTIHQEDLINYYHQCTSTIYYLM